jgi:hypothetical protein
MCFFRKRREKEEEMKNITLQHPLKKKIVCIICKKQKERWGWCVGFLNTLELLIDSFKVTLPWARHFMQTILSW